MGLLRMLTRNSADTRTPTHADLAPLSLPGQEGAVRARVIATVAKLKNWAVASDPAAESGELHLTRTTPVLRFVDDIYISFDPTSPAFNRTAIQARSQSRVGKGDLGQNRRNILELWRALTPTGG